jgi:hypothetical protein
MNPEDRANHRERVIKTVTSHLMDDRGGQIVYENRNGGRTGEMSVFPLLGQLDFCI